MKIPNDDAKLFYKLRAVFGSKWPKTGKSIQNVGQNVEMLAH